MTIHFYCPLGHRLAVPDERAGKKGRCPMCHQLVIAPVANPMPSGRDKAPSPLKGYEPSHGHDPLSRRPLGGGLPAGESIDAEDAFLKEMGLTPDDPYKLD